MGEEVMTTQNPIDLEDAEELHAQYPITFSIPRRSDRLGISPGQTVKLMFRVPEAERARVGAERMWVAVREASGGVYTGQLDNEPRFITTLKLGDLVRFEARHILAIFRAEGDPQLPFGQLVAIEANLLDGEPSVPRWVYRVEPLNFEDSGWRVYRHRGAIGERSEGLVAIDTGALLDRLRILDSILDMSVGTIWEWNEISLEYDPVVPDGSSEDEAAT